MNIFFSNSLEIHYQQLKRGLFGGGGNPLKRRIVVVYGPAMETWLMLRMAQDPELGIAMGVEFLYLNQSFEHLLKLTRPEAKWHIPSTLELALGIEKELSSSLRRYGEMNPAEQSDWLPLMNYLQMETAASPKMEKRLVGLSRHLATLFQDYGRYGTSLIEEWESDQSRGWQKQVWNALYRDGWISPVRLLKEEPTPLDNCEIHFFSLSFIARCEFDFLNRLALQTPVSYYLLSPCAVFWSDVRSDKETSYLHAFWERKGRRESQAIELEEYLRDRNPLLANFGRLGREMAYQIELSDSQAAATYQLPSHVHEIDEELFFGDDLTFEETDQPLTLLHAIQADMLLLRNPEGNPPLHLQEQISSIQLHQAPSKRREVEIIYHQLLRLIEQDPSLCPSDMIVMAPQIIDYVPYIHAVFGLGESQLDYQILDLGMETHHAIVQGFLQLIELSESRWDAHHLLQLFENRSFQRRHQLSQTDVMAIREWMEQTGIRWGENEFHRNELLRRRHCQEGMAETTGVGTWEHGWTRLMLGLTTILEEVHGVLPTEGIEFSQSDLLSRWIRLMDALRDDLAPLHDGTKLTLSDWSRYLECLLDHYFQPDFEQADSVAEYTELKNQFAVLERAGYTFPQALYPFASIKIHLQDLLQNRGIVYRENHLQSVRFCSLMPLRSIPAKVIAILGMEEGAFPRLNPHSSLNLMTGKEGCDYCPLPTDYDRYLFLEALHSAQDYLLISYQGYSKTERKELQPSLVVSELFSYLDKYYRVGEEKVSTVCHIKHPFDPFDYRYFQGKEPLYNYSQKDYQAAQVYYHIEKNPLHVFCETFPLRSHYSEDTDERIIHLKDLVAVARNPIKFHLNKGMDIYLKNSDERKLKNEEELTLSHLDKYQLKEASLDRSIEELMDRADKEGQLPFGLFKKVEMQKVEKEIESLHTGLTKHVDLNQLFQIEFSTSYEKATQIDEKLWILPALELKDSSGRSCRVIGKLPLVTPQGLILLNKGTFEDVWKIWPHFLLYLYAAEIHPEALEKQIISLGKTKSSFFSDYKKPLQQFIDYYNLCHRQLSPLLPDWIPFIYREDSKGLQEEMKKPYEPFFGGYQGPEREWALHPDRLPDAETTIAEWSPLAKSLSGDLIEAWFTKKPKEGEDV